MSAPTPLTPPEADLQDFPFMPLHVARLRDSDLAAEGHPEGNWYAVLLWSASWHQLPAGSLPNNDAVLARLCGLGRDVRTFKRRREDALRGWVLCSDGRLYHPVVAEQVIAGWKGKVEQRWRTECARIKKHNQRHGTELPSPTLEAFVSTFPTSSVPDLSLGTEPDVPGDNGSKREGQGQGQKEDNSDADASGGEAPPVTPLDPVKLMFDHGITLLGTVGKKPDAARKLLGRWRQAWGAEAVLVAIGRAVREGVSDPVSFIEGCLRSGGRHGNRTDGRADDGPRIGLVRAILDVEADRPAGGSGDLETGWGSSGPGQ